MEDTVTSEAEAAAAAEAGYANRRAAMEGAPKPTQAPVSQPPADPTPSPAPAADAPAAKGDDEPGPQAATQPAAPTTPNAISAQLEDLKAQVRELRTQGVDSATVHRMFGEIGGITRIVNKLQKQLAPTDNELSGAIAAAEKAAAEYPDIGEPMLKALKALAAQLPDKSEPKPQDAQAAPSSAAPAASAFTEKQLALIEALDGIHPDRHDINKSAEFTQWLAAQGRDYETKFKDSWDLAFLTKGYDNFKRNKEAEAAQAAAKEAARQKKKDRLTAAETPSGVTQAGPTVIPDDAGFAIGYDRIAKRRRF